MNSDDRGQLGNPQRHSRRRFLTTAVGAVVAPVIIPAAALGKDNQIAANERIAVGCIGHGNRGPTLMRGFLGQKDARVAAVCDVSGGQRAAAKQIVDRQPKNFVRVFFRSVLPADPDRFDCFEVRRMGHITFCRAVVF